jgi:hypothetical protein
MPFTKRKPSRRNGTASNDCLPYEKILKVDPAADLLFIFCLSLNVASTILPALTIARRINQLLIQRK